VTTTEDGPLCGARRGITLARTKEERAPWEWAAAVGNGGREGGARKTSHERQEEKDDESRGGYTRRERMADPASRPRFGARVKVRTKRRGAVGI
jgi:hypothetical protein